MASQGLKLGQTKHSFVVEHLDPELESWQLLEYTTIAAECQSAGSTFILSGRPAQSDTVTDLPPSVLTSPDSVDELLIANNIPKSKVCLLDPKGQQDLCPEDGDEFAVFVFGGILGDDPPRDRTAELRAKGFVGRKLGPEQMTTDTAARVTRMVVQGKSESNPALAVPTNCERDSSSTAPLDRISYIDRPDIEIAKGETISMPFKYVKGDDGKPILPKVSQTDWQTDLSNLTFPGYDTIACHRCRQGYP